MTDPNPHRGWLARAIAEDPDGEWPAMSQQEMDALEAQINGDIEEDLRRKEALQPVPDASAETMRRGIDE